MSAYEVDWDEGTEARYEAHRAQMRAEQFNGDADALDDAYELDDPKSPGFHDRLADTWDAREGK